uniref:Zinc finger PHD-type domain-containing protein n=1 Tax=Ciona savignyi TaxID=51511 RepID=H2YJR2_CIOSA
MLEILRMQQDLPLEGDEPMIEEPAVGDLDDKTTEENEANLSDEPKTNDEIGKVVKNEQSKEIRNEDVIRCVCSSEIEDGFMIQCDACYTWQHAVCEGISHNREGQSYVCKICKEPPGGRKSKQYLYNNEFITKGIPPSIFPNKEVTPEEKKFQNFMEATHKLVEEVMRVKSALAVMREKINIANPSSDHPMLRMFNETLDDGNHSSISAGVKETELGDGAVVKKDTCQPTKVTGCQMTSNEEELVRCRGNLLAHIDHMEEQLSTRTTQLEDYVTELERGVSLPEEALGSLKSDIDSIYKLLTQAVTSQ